MPSTVSAHNTVPGDGVPYLETALATLPGKLMISVSATALVALCAHVTFRLPFTPVPLVLSDFAVILVGLFLGPSIAFMTLVLYLAEGAMGLPVFSPVGGLGGVARLIGPTAGYLFAYPFAAAAAGAAARLSRAGVSRFLSAAVTGSLATAMILLSGAVWLGHLLSRDLHATWSMAIAPFLFGAAAKIVAAALIYAPTRSYSSKSSSAEPLTL